MVLIFDDANSCVIFEYESVVKISNIIEHTNAVVNVGEQWNLQKTDLLPKPLQSSRLYIYSVETSRM
jgi:hypothetical protein